VPICLTCSREIPPTSAFCAYCGRPNPEAEPAAKLNHPHILPIVSWVRLPVRARTP
jgi:predicted amidophosphoribosyltransferase